MICASPLNDLIRCYLDILEINCNRVAYGNMRKAILLPEYLQWEDLNHILHIHVCLCMCDSCMFARACPSARTCNSLCCSCVRMSVWTWCVQLCVVIKALDNSFELILMKFCFFGVCGQLNVEHHFPADPKYFDISNWYSAITQPDWPADSRWLSIVNMHIHFTFVLSIQSSSFMSSYNSCVQFVQK